MKFLHTSRSWLECVKSHEVSLIELGSKEERVFEAVGLAAVITTSFQSGRLAH